MSSVLFQSCSDSIVCLASCGSEQLVLRLIVVLAVLRLVDDFGEVHDVRIVRLYQQLHTPLIEDVAVKEYTAVARRSPRRRLWQRVAA